MIFIASDHAGIDFKRQMVQHLRGRDLPVEDLGPHDPASVDYPDFAHLLVRRVSSGAGDSGVLVCGTGIGMSMAANRHPGIRAALCHDAYTAEMARLHNDANVLCLGARVIGAGVAEQILDVFCSTAFEGGRHQRRISKIEPTEES